MHAYLRPRPAIEIIHNADAQPARPALRWALPKARKKAVKNQSNDLDEAAFDIDLEGTSERRSHPRMSMTIPVQVEADDGSEPCVVQNQDISWGGVRFVAPKDAFLNAGSVRVTLPWSSGKKISAIAEVLRTERLDADHAMIAARFSELSTADHHRLEKLLKMLRVRANEASTQDVPLVPILEILFSDIQEIQEKLAEIEQGHIAVTTFESYEAGQSIRLVLGGIAAVPALRLRARVTHAELVSEMRGSDWSMYTLNLAFEHPIAELKAATAKLRERLAAADTSDSLGSPGFDSYLLDDPLE